MSKIARICVRSPESDGREVARVSVARTPLSRAVGLLGRTGISRGSGLLLWQCRAIHTAFMMFSIDALFLNEEFVVVAIRKRLRPFGVAVGPYGTMHTLELPSGTAEEMQLAAGSSLALVLTEE